MAGELHLQIVTPQGVQLTEEIQELTAPSVDGQFGVLPGHRPMLAALATGIVTYGRPGQEPTQVAVGPGYVQIQNDRAVVLTDRFSTKDAIDAVAVRLQLKEADQALDDFAGELDSAEHSQLVANELWAAALLELYGDPPPPTLRGFRESPPPQDFSSKESNSDETE